MDGEAGTVVEISLMRAALHTWSFRRKFAEGDAFDIYRAFDATAEMGFGAVEMMIGQGRDPRRETGLADFERETVRRATHYGRRRGVETLSYSTFNDFALADAEARERHIACVKRWIRLAAENEVENIRFLTGYYREGQDRAEEEKRTLAGIEEVAPDAERYGVNLSLENHNTIFLSADDMLELREQFGPRLTACPDPTNWVKGYFDAEPSEQEKVYGELEKVAGWATQSHLKLKGLEGEDGLLGYDLLRILRIYRDAGYKGAIAFESVVYGKDEPEGDLTEILPEARRRLEAGISKVLQERRRPPMV